MRPLTKRMSPSALYAFVNWYAPKLMPLARVMHAVGGRAGRRLVPILDQQDKRVSREVQRDWTILDTYDALGPAYDQPQTFETVRRWFDEAGFRDVEMFRGPIGGGGLCARGVKI
ncbi:MAG: hypothetical protein JNM07_01255 [Phycisphaerae bacterium]|nr:hypothetical protein [Phycisphaerae bacterium]